MPAIRWSSRDGATAIATLQGAHLVSWTPAGGAESLYLSERSAFEVGRPIRGGIPVCFPQFAERGPLVKHGFARTQAWTFLGAGESDAGAHATFALEASPATKALWPGSFRLELVATIGGPRLDVELRVHNTGWETFAFQAALHTYLRVADAAGIRLQGLRGTSYLELGETVKVVEDREIVTAKDPIDRIYFASPRSTRLEDAGRVLAIQQDGFSDTVVWNPGPDFTATMADMPPDGWRHMVCVEAAAIEPRVQMRPGARWTAGQVVTAQSTADKRG